MITKELGILATVGTSITTIVKRETSAKEQYKRSVTPLIWRITDDRGNRIGRNLEKPYIKEKHENWQTRSIKKRMKLKGQTMILKPGTHQLKL